MPITLLVDTKQRRLENRDLCADLVKVAWTSEEAPFQTDWAILGDISPSGACLEIDEPVPVNAIVDLEFGGDRCRAVVQYCKYDKVNYLLGVKFQSGYRWSSNRWEPKHLVQYHIITKKTDTEPAETKRN